MLSSLMIDQAVGVTPEAAYEIKRVDSDYFNEAWPPSHLTLSHHLRCP